MALAVGGLRRRPLRRCDRGRDPAEPSLPRQCARRASAAVASIAVCRAGLRPPGAPGGRTRLAHTSCSSCIVVALWVIASGRPRSLWRRFRRSIRWCSRLAAAGRAHRDDRDQRHSADIGVARQRYTIAESASRHCHHADRSGHRTGDRNRDHDVDAPTQGAGRTCRRARGHPRRECSPVTRSRHRRRTGTTGTRNPRHAGAGIHQHRHAGAGRRTGAGNRHRGRQTTRRVDPHNRPGEPRRGTGDGGRADSDGTR